MATVRTETTRGPTYSMTRAIGATPWRKGFICRCHCLHCHYSPLTVEVTRHMDRPLQWPHRWVCRQECNLSVDTSCKAHGVLDPCACSNRTERAWHACWTIASLTIRPDPPSVLQLCISVDFVSYTVAWGFMLSHILITVMCMKLLSRERI